VLSLADRGNALNDFGVGDFVLCGGELPAILNSAAQWEVN
jgi:tRNA G37 N-methylase TrmD